MATEIISGPVKSADAVAAAAAAAPPIRIGSTGAVPTSTPVRPNTPAEPKTPAIAPPVKPSIDVKPNLDKGLSDKLRAKASPQEATTPEEVAPAKDTIVSKPEDAKKGGETTPVADPKEKGKASPWKMLDEQKARTKELETKLVEAEKRSVPEAKWKDMETQLESQRKRNEELESQIRLMDYSKSSEFKDKYQKPYEDAWGRAMGNLNGLTVQDAEGNERDVNAQDLMSLVAEPNLRTAFTKAKEIFGDDIAPLVMGHRNEIRKLYDDQRTALESASKTAGEHAETSKKNGEALRAEISTQWSTVNEAAKADPTFGKFFTPVEGDQDGNQRLAKGYELVDRAFSESPQAPGLTAEQRKEIISRHAVVRNRAAAFGRLRSWLDKSESRVKELEKELAEYKGTEPSTKSGGKGEQQPTEETGLQRVFGKLRSKAKVI